MRAEGCDGPVPRLRRIPSVPVTRLIGLDVGAVTALSAYVREDGRPALLGERDASATVTVSAGRCRVGAGPGDTAAGVARHVVCRYGEPGWRLAVPGGGHLRAAEVGALIVRDLATGAARRLGEPVTGAVLTAPAGFGDAARRTARQACAIAGLRVYRVLQQPTAVGLAALDRGLTDSTALVYALGGSAFDVAVVRIEPDAVEVLAARGDARLGGLDWDTALMRLLDPDGRLRGDAAREPALRAVAEAARRRLSLATRTAVRAGALGLDTTVSRARFGTATAGLVERTRVLTEQVVAEAGLGWDTLDRVLLAGGATRMPMVRRMLEDRWGRRIGADVDPDLAAVAGAAVYADRGADLQAAGTAARSRPPVRVREVSSHGLGTLTRDPDSGVLHNTVVLRANTALPASRRRTVSTLGDNQRAVHLELTQGDTADPAGVRRIGAASIALPPLAAGAPLGLDCGYDADHVPHLTITDLGRGTILHRDVVRNTDLMSRRELAEAVRRAGRIKPA
jgi:molecular chaperone DnaK